MSTRTASIQSDRRTLADDYATPTRTVVAAPPSDIDPAAFLMRVWVGGWLTLRPYDDDMEQP